MRWLRDERYISTERVVVFDNVIPKLRLLAREGAGRLRLGLWVRDSLVVGWTLPGLPAGAFLDIEGTTATGYIDGEARPLHNFVRSYDGGWPDRVTLPRGTYRLTLDQDPDRATEVNVEVTMQAFSE